MNIHKWSERPWRQFGVNQQPMTAVWWVLAVRDGILSSTFIPMGTSIQQFMTNRGNIILCDFCYPVFFLFIMHPARTVALILTLNNSNDVFPPKDGPSGGQDDGWHHLGKIYAKYSPKRGLNRQFPVASIQQFMAAVECVPGPVGSSEPVYRGISD